MRRSPRELNPFPRGNLLTVIRRAGTSGGGSEPFSASRIWHPSCSNGEVLFYCVSSLARSGLMSSVTRNFAATWRVRLGSVHHPAEKGAGLVFFESLSEDETSRSNRG